MDGLSITWILLAIILGDEGIEKNIGTPKEGAWIAKGVAIFNFQIF